METTLTVLKVISLLAVLLSPVLSSEVYVNGTTGCHPHKDNGCQLDSGFADGHCIYTESGQGVSIKSREVKPGKRTCYDTQANGLTYVLSKSDVYNAWNPSKASWCCAAAGSIKEGNLMVVKASYSGYCDCTTEKLTDCAGGASANSNLICQSGSHKCDEATTAKAMADYEKVSGTCNLKPPGMAAPTPPPAPPPDTRRRKDGGSAPRRRSGRRRRTKSPRRRRSARRRSSSRRRRSSSPRRRRSSRRRGGSRRRRSSSSPRRRRSSRSRSTGDAQKVPGSAEAPAGAAALDASAFVFPPPQKPAQAGQLPSP